MTFHRIDEADDLALGAQDVGHFLTAIQDFFAASAMSRCNTVLLDGLDGFLGAAEGQVKAWKDLDHGEGRILLVAKGEGMKG
mmetsp:Transcript_22282/g.62735  ORF Transcript_22282/g.62735 Transcript_22282/m.62735 type:complete len:82 (+) Transcript_22282:66-311(+)